MGTGQGGYKIDILYPPWYGGQEGIDRWNVHKEILETSKCNIKHR